MKRLIYAFIALVFMSSCQNKNEILQSNGVFAEIGDPKVEQLGITLTDEQLKELFSIVVPVEPETRAPFFWVTSNADVNYYSQFPLFVINFTADWCGACRMYEQIFYNVADECEYDGAYFGCCNVDAYPDIVASFGINSVPCTLFISGNFAQNVVLGILSKSLLEYYVDLHYPDVDYEEWEDIL